jgi:hypothetical protein
MKFWSDFEVDLLIDEISEAAYEAIEMAAAEAARAAALAALEREAAALREAARREAEAQRWRLEAEANLRAITEARRTGRKNAVIAGALCFIGGLVFGVGGTLLITR